MRTTSSVMTSTEQQDTDQEGFMEIAMAPYESGFEIVSSHSAVAGGNKLNIISFLLTLTTLHQYIYYLYSLLWRADAETSAATSSGLHIFASHIYLLFISIHMYYLSSILFLYNTYSWLYLINQTFAANILFTCPLIIIYSCALLCAALFIPSHYIPVYII